LTGGCFNNLAVAYRRGLPRRFADYADYVEAVDELIASGAVPDPSFLRLALDRVRWLAAAVGADRQGAVAAWSGSLEHLVARLAGRFLAPDWLAATAGPST
jgi:hypothetical protein